MRAGQDVMKQPADQPTRGLSHEGPGHKCLWEKDSGNMDFEPDTKRVIVISDAGKVIRYSLAQD